MIKLDSFCNRIYNVKYILETQSPKNNLGKKVYINIVNSYLKSLMSDQSKRHALIEEVDPSLHVTEIAKREVK